MYVWYHFTEYCWIVVGIKLFSLLKIICLTFTAPQNIWDGSLQVLVYLLVCCVSVGIYLQLSMLVGTCLCPIYLHNIFHINFPLWCYCLLHQIQRKRSFSRHMLHYYRSLYILNIRAVFLQQQVLAKHSFLCKMLVPNIFVVHTYCYMVS